MQKVGNKISEDSKKYLHYPDIKYDADGWANASEYLPVDFDILYLKVEGLKGIIRGWSTGTSWDGAKLPHGSKILYWKRSREDD